MNDQVEKTIRILKARLAMSEPIPEPLKVPTDWSKLSWLATPAAILVGFALLVIGPRYLPSVDPTPLPLPPAPVVVVPVKIDPADAIATLNGIRLDTERTKLLCDLVNAGEGTFALRYQPVGQAELTRQVIVSGDKPPVPPIPPGPTPPPVPPTPVPPVPSGPLTILLLRESKDSTPEMASLIRDLRTGVSADYLKSKSHSLGILDVDAKDKDGNPSPAVQEWQPQFSGLSLPAMLMYDPTTKAVLHKQSVPSGTTATAIISAIKEHGG